jgi:chromosomal replication initiator protein
MASLIGSNPYRTWFNDRTQLQLEGSQLDITVPNAFVGNWISANYMSQITQAAREVVGEEPHVQVRVDAPPAAAAPVQAPAVVQAPVAERATPRRQESRPVLRGELDSFVVGPSNELAYSVVSALSRAPGETFKHLVLHANCGLGKTHLLHGICNAVNRTRPDLEWRYLSGEEFTNEFVYAVKTNRIDLFRARFRNIDLLVIDDVHFLADKRATQEEFLHTFNAIDATGKAVVLSCDRHPRSITSLSEPLANRLMAAMIVEVYPPDFQTRREILRRRAKAMLCDLPEEVLDYLAQRITRNVRELEGALFKLAAFASLTREPLSLDLARRTVEDYVSQSTRAPDAGEIERVVAAHFGVTVDALHSGSRDRTVTQARATAMFLVRKHTRMSFPEIGRFMGNKQHSTVLMAVRRVQDALDAEGTLAWKTPSGPREVPAQELLDMLEQRVLRGPES